MTKLRKRMRKPRQNRRLCQEPARTSAMSKLRKRDDADRDSERERSGAALNDHLRIFDKTQEHKHADFAWRGDAGLFLG